MTESGREPGRRSLRADLGRFALVATVVACLVVYFLAPTCNLGMTRYKCFYVKSHSLKELGDALEVYAAKHGAYPAWSASPKLNAFSASKELRARERYVVPTIACMDESGGNLTHLTAPITFLDAYPVDPFTEPFKVTFAYWSTPAGEQPGGVPGSWIIWSPGPDGDYDITAGNVAAAYNPADEGIPNPILLSLTYDPTNGSTSSGDIYRTKQ